MWRTRRRNQYLSALGSVLKHAQNEDLPRLLLSFATITEYLAPFIRVAGTELPRGYVYQLNSLREPTFLKGDAMLNPSYCDPPPPLEIAVQFAWDLRKGWLDELAVHLGYGSGFGFVAEALKERS